MTESEAIKELKQNSCVDCAIGCDSPIYCNAVCDYSDAINMAIEALEKQIPKKPIENIEYPICPSCSKPFYHGCNDKYCVDCGQKLDWSEEE